MTGRPSSHGCATAAVSGCMVAYSAVAEVCCAAIERTDVLLKLYSIVLCAVHQPLETAFYREEALVCSLGTLGTAGTTGQACRVFHNSPN